MGYVSKFYYNTLLYAYPITLQGINDKNIKLEVYLTCELTSRIPQQVIKEN